MRSSLQLVWIAQRVCMIQNVHKTASTDVRYSGTAGLIWTIIITWLFMLALIASVSVSPHLHYMNVC
jgi:hypothetical protein